MESSSWQRFGAYAGWAHTLLFAADLVRFRDRRAEALGDAAASTPAPRRKKRAPAAPASRP